MRPFAVSFTTGAVVIMSNLLRCFGATENRLHLGQKQCKSKAETKLVLAMLRRSLRSLESKLKPCRFGSALGLHCFSSLELSHEPQCKPKAEGKFYLHSAEAKPALAAKQQQYAPSFSLSAPCILLTPTRRLRVISNAYFDTPSFLF